MGKVVKLRADAPQGEPDAPDMPSEIRRVAEAGFVVDPGLWFARCRDFLGSDACTDKRRISLNAYGEPVRKRVREHKRNRAAFPELWFRQDHSHRWSTHTVPLHSLTKQGGIRDAVIARPGHKLIRVDYSGAHFTIAAVLSGDPLALEHVRAGDAYERAVASFCPELAGEPARSRKCAKICSLTAINGGGGGDRGLRPILADYGIEADGAEANRRKRAWLEPYGKLRELLADPPASWTLPAIDGIEAREVTPGPDDGIAGLRWQSYEALALRVALRELERESVRVVFVFYDEILAEAPIGDAPAVLEKVQSAMNRAMRAVLGLDAGPADQLLKGAILDRWSGADLPAADLLLKDPGPEEGIDGRRRIQLSDRVDRNASAVLRSLRRLPDLFDQDGVLVRVGSSGKIKALTAAALTASMARAGSYYKWRETSKTKGWIPTTAPRDLASVVLEEGDLVGLRPLAGVTRAPVISPNGEIVSTRGYHAGSQLFYAGPVIEVPTAPTLADAMAARDRVLDCVREFPFKGEADLSAWFACVLSMAMRPMIRGNVPMFVAEANQARLGKTMILSMASLIAYGKPCPTKGMQDWSLREWDKSVSSVAIKGTTGAVLIDNVPRGTPIGCATLESFLANYGPQQIRPLGEKEDVEVDCRVVWLASGNRPAYREDMTGRVIPIRLEDMTPNPEARSFERADPMGWVWDHQLELQVDVLTIVRAWLLANPEPQDLPILGSFEPWTAHVRQVLAWLGMVDPLGTRADLRGSNVDTEAHDRLIGILAEMFATGDPFRGADLATVAENRGRDASTSREPWNDPIGGDYTRGDLQDVLEQLGLYTRSGREGTVSRSKLGAYLSGHLKQPAVGGVWLDRLAQSASSKRSARYVVCFPDPDEPT